MACSCTKCNVRAKRHHVKEVENESQEASITSRPKRFQTFFWWAEDRKPPKVQLVPPLSGMQMSHWCWLIMDKYWKDGLNTSIKLWTSRPSCQHQPLMILNNIQFKTNSQFCQHLKDGKLSSKWQSCGFRRYSCRDLQMWDQELIRKLTSLYLRVWEQESVPQEFKDTHIIHLYKRKGSWASCDNRCGILLLATAGKILAHIRINWLADQLAGKILLESPMWLLPWAWYFRHDLCTLANSGEMSWAESRPICSFCQSY